MTGRSVSELQESAPVDQPAEALCPLAAFDDAEALERGRTHLRWICRGFGIGIVVACLVTAVNVVINGYNVLPMAFFFDQSLKPLFCAIVGFQLSRIRSPGLWKFDWSWKRPQLRIQTLMVVVAYVAFLFGVGIATKRLGDAYRDYRRRYFRSLDVAQELREEQAGGFTGGESKANYVRRLCQYHESLAAKYERAMRRPWIPVEPDPEPPPSQ